MQQVVSLGCIACLNQGDNDTPAEIHHLRSGVGQGQRSSHYRTLPLCHIHHRTGGYGLAFHAGPKEWQRIHGTEEDLLAQVKTLLQIDV